MGCYWENIGEHNENFEEHIENYHWDVDGNTLGTTKIQHSSPYPQGKKNWAPWGPWWHTSLVGQEFLCLPLLFIIFDLEKKKKNWAPWGVHGGPSHWLPRISKPTFILFLNHFLG
jgi:hypothetical protein